MRHIYNLMKRSNEKANDDTYYPDICTFEINEFNPQSSYETITVSQNDLDRKDLLAYKMYNVTDLDDLVLFMNRKDYIHNMEVGERLNIYNSLEVEEFYNTHVK